MNDVNHYLNPAEEKMEMAVEYLDEALAHIRAGKANMFLSPLFRSTLATLCDARIELFDTDGSLGAARGAALGAGIYKSADEAFATLERLDVIEPAADWKNSLESAYMNWKKEVNNAVKNL